MTDLDLCPRSFLSLMWYVCNFMLNFGAILKVVAQTLVLSPMIYIYLMATKLFQVQAVLKRKLFAVSTRNIPQQKPIRTLTLAMALAQGKWVKVCFLTQHFSFASIVCFCFLRLTLFFRCTFIWFHLFHTYQFIEKEEKVWLVWLISLCFLDRKVGLIFEGFTFDYLSLVSL